MVSSSGGNLVDTHQDCGAKTTEAEDEESEFFPREPSDSGLLEEIVHRFLPKSKPDLLETPQKAEALSLSMSTPQLLPSQPVSDHDMLVSPTALCYDHITQREVTKTEGFGVSLDYQGFPMQQFDGFHDGYITPKAMPLRNVNDHHLMMSEAECSIMGDIFQYPELLNEFAARMQNA